MIIKRPGYARIKEVFYYFPVVGPPMPKCGVLLKPCKRCILEIGHDGEHKW